MGVAESAYHHPTWTSSILPEPITETGGPNPELKLQVDQGTGAAQFSGRVPMIANSRPAIAST